MFGQAKTSSPPNPGITIPTYSNKKKRNMKGYTPAWNWRRTKNVVESRWMNLIEEESRGNTLALRREGVKYGRYIRNAKSCY